MLAGTPTAFGTFNFTVRVTDGLGVATTKAFQLTVNPAALVVTTTSPLPAGTVGTAYSTTLAATGGVTPYSWSIAGGQLPAGLALSTGGVVSGTPSAFGTFNFTAQVTDNVGTTATKAFAITIQPAALLITTPSPLPTGTVGTAYSGTFNATGGVTPYTWSVTAGTLPPGLALSSAGVLSGTPTQYGAFSFTVQATDNRGASTTKAFSLTINPAALVITTISLPGGVQNAPYNATLAAAGGVRPMRGRSPAARCRRASRSAPTACWPACRRRSARSRSTCA